MRELPPLSLYIHIPWCVKKCPYCDFNSHAQQGALPEREYVAALLADLEQDIADHGIQGREVQTVFFGGGTPSLFSSDAIGAILAGARARLPFAADAEITLEANPGTVEHARFRAYRDAGVTRISLGVQSFDEARLRTLGRIHGAREVDTAIAELHASGLATFNLDLMYALPAQDEAGALADVRRAIASDAPHVSHYELTLEPNTLFHARPPSGLPDDEQAWAIQEACHAELRAAGYAQYEVSAWAKPGQQCRHNLNYWEFGDYLGIGAGAHAKLSHADGTVWRTWKHKHPATYLERAASAARLGGREARAPADLVFEFMLNATRLAAGFRPETFEARTGLPWAALGTRVEAMVDAGLLHQRSGHWAATPLGWRRMNDLQAAFLP
jgi:putative oxygen-independent coproporphyrinogen III oxidase